MVGKLHISIRAAISMLVSFVLVFASVSHANAVGSTAQTISWTTNVPTPKFVGDADFTPSGATSTSALAVTYNVTNSAGVCSWTGAGKIHLDGPGTCIVTADQAGDGTYAAATQLTKSFYVMPANQKQLNGLTVCFTAPWTHCEINGLSYGWDYATSKYTTFAKTGEDATILANQASGATQLGGTAPAYPVSGVATGYYTNTSSAAESLNCSISMTGTGSHSVTIGGTSLSVSVGNGSSSSSRSGSIAAGATVAVSSVFSWQSNYGQPVRWIVPCTIGGRNFTTDSFASAIRPSITTVTPATGLPAGGNTIVIAGSNFGASGAAVTIDGVNCPIVGAHTATSITCRVPSSSGVSKVADIVVTAADGTSGSKASGYAYEAATYPLPTNSAAPVISTSATSPYAIGSSIVSTLGTWDMKGDPTTTTTVKWQVCATAQSLTCTDIPGAIGTPWPATADVANKYVRSVVTATNNGGSTSANSNIIGPFGKANQTLQFTSAISPKSVGVTDFYPAITYSPATPIRVATLSSNSASVCTVIENKIHIVAHGTCSITAAMESDDTFLTATPVTTTFEVVSPIFTGGTNLTSSGNAPKWHTPYSYQYEFSNPNATFAITSGALPAGLTLSASGLISGETLVKPGDPATYEYTVTATDASGSYEVTTTMSVRKGEWVIVGSGVHGFTSSNGRLYAVVDHELAPVVPLGQEVGWWYFETMTPTICTVSRGGLITVVKAGSCSVILTEDVNGYSRALAFSDIWTSSVRMPAPLKANTITFAAPTNQVSSAPDFVIAPKAASGVTPTVTSSTTSVCTVSGLTVHLVAVGTCTLTASGAGSATFAEATAVTRSFSVMVSPEAPTITAATAAGAAGTTALVTFTNGNLNGWTPTGYQVTATPASGQFGFPSTVSCPTVGVACVVTGLTPGVEYTFVASTLASSGTLSAKVDSAPSSPVLVKLPQEITLVSPGVKRPDAGSFPLFPVSDIGSVVTPDVESTTPSVCTVDNNNVVTIVGPGTCSLSVTSPGTTARGIAYGDATPVAITFPVSATAPAVTTISPLANATVGVAVNIANTATPGSVAVPIPTTVAGTWTAVGLPAGLVIDSKTGKITGTPTAPGVYDQILVTVKDKAGVIASKPLSLTVAAAPGIVGPSTVAVVSGKPAVVDDLVAMPGTATIPSTGAWAITAGTLPLGLTLNPDTGVVSGTPSGVVGKVTVTITLTDSAPLTATKVLTFDVASAPVFGAAGGANPAATINLVGVAKVPGMKLASGSAFVVPAVVPGTAGKPKKGAYTAVPTGSSMALPDGIVFNADTGAITGTPLVPGTYDFKVVFTDAKGLTAEQPYRFVVATPPTITNPVMLPVYTVPATGTAPVFTVDLEGEQGTNSIPGTAAWSATGLPAGLTIDPNTGVITGTPPTRLTKDYTFKIKLVDSAGLIAEKTFTLPVIKAGVNKTTLNLPVEIASGTLFTDELYDLNGDNEADPVITPAGASSMGLAVTYGVNATSVATCFVDADNMLHIIGAGVCGVTASSGTAAAKNVSVATQSFVVSKRSQVLTVTAPGETVVGASPAVTAPEATDDPAGFKLAATLSSGLDPVYTVIPAKNPNGTDKDPNCAVDDAGNVTWLYDMTLATTAPGYDVNGGKCRVAISHPGNTNYGSVATQFLDLVVTHVTPSAPNDDNNVEPGVSMGLPRTGGTVSKGGVGFTVKVTPTGVTVQPISSGLYIGPITAKISIEYKVGTAVQTQACSTSFGIAIRDAKKNVVTNPALETKAAIAAITAPYRAMPKGGPKGYLASKKFTNSVTCALNKDAIAFFKAGGQLKANAEVLRDRRWPTTYKAAKPNGEKIAPRTVNWVLKVG